MGDRDHYLHGAEDVRSAASSMRSAADTMSSAASSMHSAADQMQRIFDDFLQRLGALLEEDREARKPIDLSIGAPTYRREGHRDICTPDRCHCGSQ